MDLKQVEQLLSKYWEGETSLSEEKQLQQFFSYGEVPAHLLVYRDLFVAQEIILNPDLGLDFDREVLDKLDTSENSTRWNFVRIAAIGLILIVTAIGFFKLNNTTNTQPIAQEDTYQNPEEALAETKKAFAMMAVAFNKGQQPVMNIVKLDKTNQKVAKAFGRTSQLPILNE
ncbi:MAG: hypothetical protein DRI54_05460 [Bacteroidetes bacterium]|nr:MAG: hypothetical protein DRI54_05460 [Bacteroidota bacterium]